VSLIVTNYYYYYLIAVKNYCVLKWLSDEGFARLRLIKLEGELPKKIVQGNVLLVKRRSTSKKQLALILAVASKYKKYNNGLFLSSS